MRSAIDVKVWTFLPGIELMPETEQLVYRLRFYLDVKDSSYYILKSLLQEHPLEALKLEESILEEEFGFFSLPDVRSNFHLFAMQDDQRSQILEGQLEKNYEAEAD